MKQGLDEKLYIKVNGIRQGMFLQSEDIGNPVLLFLHGGPGSPEIAFTQKHPAGLDKLFTVCWWEQRGAGMTYRRETAKETMTLEQMIEDTIAVTHYLRSRFGKEKIYVMGHSWGSLLGVLTVSRAPELFHAYVGIGQVVQQAESERLAYTYMLNEFQKGNNHRMVKKLKRFRIDRGEPIVMPYFQVRNEGMLKLGIGIMHNMKSMKDSVLEVLTFKGYTWREKLRFPMGNAFSLNCLLDTVLQFDVIKQVPELKIPVYVLQGKYDYQVSYVLAKKFLAAVKAPVKGFYTFENSAHSPCFEEAGKMCHILSGNVLQGKADLADRPEGRTQGKS